MQADKVQIPEEFYALLGEGPIWDERSACLYWVDILGKRLMRIDEHGHVESRQMEVYVGAIALREGNGLVLATQQGFQYYDWSTGLLERISDPESEKPGNRFNDGKCDPAGRFWAGTMSLSSKMNQGALYRLDADQSVHTMLEGVSISNGLAWSHDHKRMYYIDTPTSQVVSFDYDRMTGSIANPQAVLAIPSSEGYPDGMTIDAEGNLWIAHYGGFQVSRWNPDTGQQIDKIQLPVPYVTSCTFGGKDRNILYITTAREGLTEEQLEKYPQAGALFQVQTDVTGGNTYRYTG